MRQKFGRHIKSFIPALCYRIAEATWFNQRLAALFVPTTSHPLKTRESYSSTSGRASRTVPEIAPAIFS